MRFLSFLKIEAKYQFDSFYVLWGYFFGILLNLTVYYFTAKAFSPNLSLQNAFLSKGYFEFIIIGELCLMIPQISISEGQEAFFRLKEAGVLGHLYFSRTGFIASLVNVYFSLIFFKLIFILCSLYFGILFFHLSLDSYTIIKFILIQVLSSLFFISFYLCNLSISILIGRRNNSFNQLVNVLSFFSGAYFPLEIFSSPLLKNILSHSPFALHVSITRSLIYRGVIGSAGDGISYLGWSIVPLLLSFVFYKYAEKRAIGKLLN